jgi:hypothetical protein
MRLIQLRAMPFPADYFYLKTPHSVTTAIIINIQINVQGSIWNAAGSPDLSIKLAHPCVRA